VRRLTLQPDPRDVPSSLQARVARHRGGSRSCCSRVAGS